MNVILKLPEELARAARHRAGDQSQSLSSWVIALVRRELSQTLPQTSAPSQSWMESLRIHDAPAEFYEQEFPLPDRKATRHREFVFETEDQ